MSTYTVGALFAGYGGLDLGLAAVLPTRTAWLAEYDAAPSRILAARFPGVPNIGDVTTVNWADLEPVDIITGGSPCQDLSHAGKRMGMKPGTRSGLWASMLAAITTIRPSLVIWENVRGALSAEATSELEPCTGCVGGDDDGPVLRALGRVLGDLASIGYDAAWTGLRAADVGAPHGRFRVFVLAWPADAPGAGLEAWGEGRHGGSAPAASTGPAANLTLLPTPTVNDMGAGKELAAWDAWTERMKSAHGNGNGHGRSLDVEARRLHVEGALLPTPRATDGTKGGPNQRGSSGDLMLSSAVQLMPTPKAADSRASGGDPSSANVTLTDATVRGRGLMPTPSVADVEGGRKHRSGARSGELLLNGLAHAQAFGQYAPAVARWEAITRPAPAPTEPTGKNGAHRLSPRFVEWLMGLPDGWVTGESVEAWRHRLADRRAGLDARPVGHRGSVARAVAVVSRNEQLKALGNGVVPQQAAAAITHLLTIREQALTHQTREEAAA